MKQALGQGGLGHGMGSRKQSRLAGWLTGVDTASWNGQAYWNGHASRGDSQERAGTGQAGRAKIGLSLACYRLLLPARAAAPS
jgi:hypothetical protein